MLGIGVNLYLKLSIVGTIGFKRSNKFYNLTVICNYVYVYTSIVLTVSRLQIKLEH